MGLRFRFEGVLQIDFFLAELSKDDDGMSESSIVSDCHTRLLELARQDVDYSFFFRLISIDEVLLFDI